MTKNEFHGHFSFSLEKKRKYIHNFPTEISVLAKVLENFMRSFMKFWAIFNKISIEISLPSQKGQELILLRRATLNLHFFAEIGIRGSPQFLQIWGLHFLMAATPGRGGCVCRTWLGAEGAVPWRRESKPLQIFSVELTSVSKMNLP